MSARFNVDHSRPRPILVWDVWVRIFHWLLVICVAVAAFIGFFGPANFLTIHLTAGLAAGALVAWRVIWGFCGSTYARFQAFPPNLYKVLSRLSELKNGAHRRYLSHNPLGAVMVYALLSVIAIIVTTGAVALGGELKQGPLAFVATYSFGSGAHQIHKLMAVLLMGLIGLHLLGVAYETFIGKQRLVPAMIDGRKSAAADAELSPVRGSPILTFVMFAVTIGGLSYASELCVVRPALGVPGATDPIYVRECGACHLAYPPSIATAATWKMILETLDHHFGEDATLSDVTMQYLAQYLAEQSSEHFDTRIAHVFVVTDPDDPLRLTATPFWRRHHDNIPDFVFASRAVRAKAACDACHHDTATGRFDPQVIDIPAKAFK